ncbi:MAG: CDP-diacylglycerol--serine O-phosphatidyltransferase, partial [Sedimenticola sp.]|nr:CDP-diacylglycerol--serine O-phosphatidyltransferase [Sedimenticola sp.]MCW9022472.1 CDP-diacylglycerol--serine O-phosphatidyltransferase [Sedimenticola sp.]
MEIMPEAPQQQKPSRGIYLLPNLFTTAALFSGFYAVLAAMGGKFEHAAVAIFVAMVMDGLDGRVARLTNTQTAFGAEYDSLSDMVAFGLAPSLVMYVWSLNHLGKLGWLAAFIYTAGAALRLARFNTQVGTADKRYFQGLPSPAAAAILAGSVWVAVEYQIAGADVSLLVCFITLASGLLMVSNVRYNSFKEIDFKGKIPFVSVVVMMLVLAVVISQPPTVLFIIFMAYAISGPVLTLRNLQQRRAER